MGAFRIWNGERMLTGLAEEIWRKKYKFATDHSWDDSAMRIAQAVGGDSIISTEKYYAAIRDLVFIPGGRITAGAGTKNNYLLNCAVLEVSDSIEGIYETIKRAAVLAKCNYGVGYNFSKIRPKNSNVSKGGTASGPVSFMRIFDTSGSVIETGGGRRAASIAVLNVNHPDIFEFIDAKRQEGILTQFNISVGVTKAFIKAVEDDADWDLVWGGTVYDTVKARAVWKKLCESGYLYNDPGLLFIDEINKYNNAWYLYDLDAVNPCGELPLPPNGVCCLGSINLTKFVKNPFSGSSWKDNFDLEGYGLSIALMVRFLDDVLDASDYPYPEIKERVTSDRRIGLNPFAGLGSTLAMLEIPYDSPSALEFMDFIGEFSLESSYNASINLSIERGPFPNYDVEKFLDSNFVKEKLNEKTKASIREHGIRNVALLTVPPVGTGSLIAGNISNGLEPIFSLEYTRRVRQPDQSIKEEAVEDFAWSLWKKTLKPLDEKPEGYTIPEFFKTSREISPKAHVRMQATIQKYIDGSLSKTCNMPESTTQAEYEELLWYAIKSGCKGFTTFREGTREGILIDKKEKKAEAAPVVSTDPPKRPRFLDGRTYQIKDTSDRRTYCTINSVMQDGKMKPWEIFLFSKSEHHEWYAALGVLMSAIMRKVGEVDFIIKDLKEISGDHGYLTPEYGYVGSKPQHIALILEEYIAELNGSSKVVEYMPCPECKEKTYIKEGGCKKCTSCGYSECG